MNCHCTIQVNQLLEESGEYLKLRGQFSPVEYRGQVSQVLMIQTKKEGGKKGAPVMATYCPFCGKKYNQAKYSIK